MRIERISIPSECYNVLQRESLTLSVLKDAIDREKTLGLDYYETAVLYKSYQYLLEYYKDMVNAALADSQGVCRWSIDPERPNTLILYIKEIEVNNSDSSIGDL